MLNEPQKPQMSTGLSTPTGLMVGGVVRVMNNSQLDAANHEEQEKVPDRPEVAGIAGHIQSAWIAARNSKQVVEQRMLQALRQRRGEYDPVILSEIQKTGGSEIYMMLTSNKCRSASAWIKDSLLGAKDEKPWTISATKLPDLPPNAMQSIAAQAAEEAYSLEQATGQFDTTPVRMAEILSQIKARATATIQDAAAKKVARMEEKMEDQLQEGNFTAALTAFIDDLTTFPSAFIKGPVIRNKNTLKWVQKGQQYEPQVEKDLVYEWERVDPFMMYPSPESSSVQDGALIERHRMRRIDLEELKGVEGYSDVKITEVLEHYGKGGLRDWLTIDMQKAAAEGKNTLYASTNEDGLIDALQYWGNVQGSLLRDWGMSKEEIPDETKEYFVEAWLIGSYVIKATLNYDPFGRKPYYKASYEEIPGAFWGNSVADLVRDCQIVCNAAARAMVNNLGIASGPQVVVNVDRIPAGEDITQMYPWKIWQTTSDPFTNTTLPPVEFFQPGILSSELLAIHDRFSVMADEYSGVPRYMTGDASVGGAGRTASGMSMLMGNAGKAIKQVISNIDKNVIAPLIERQYYYNMRFGTDPEMKGDVRIVARGANGLMLRESAQQRRNEFLNIIGQNQMFSQIVGQEGIANLLRESVKTLDMNSEKIIPSEDALRAQQLIAAKQAAQQQGMQGNTVTSSSGQALQDGAPVTDNFSPMRK